MASTIDGTWISAKPRFTFTLHQHGSEVTGDFRDEIVTFALKGTFAGNVLTARWETAFSWTGTHDSGTGTLTLAADGTLRGEFRKTEQPGTWVFALTRTGAGAHPHPSAPPPHTTHRRPHPGSSGQPRPPETSPPETSPPETWPPEMVLKKKVWDAKYDDGLLAHLRKEA